VRADATSGSQVWTEMLNFSHAKKVSEFVLCSSEALKNIYSRKGSMVGISYGQSVHSSSRWAKSRAC
jgi:enoyl-[acyl-carrier-protein] reductase (NADH)